MQKKERTPTIKDVAKRAGVSVATVSAVINRNRFVSSELVEKVFKAIQELGYHPNRIARGLKKRQSFNVVYIIPDITNPIFASVTRGIQDVMEKSCYDVSIYNTDFSDKKLFHQLTNVLENRPDGIILSAWHSPEIKRAISLIQQFNIPLVLVHAPRNVEGIDAIFVDDENGAFEAVNYLLRLGHRKVLSLGVKNSTTSSLREAGYRKAFKKMGLSIEEKLVLKSDSFAPQSACLSIYKALKSNINFTAVFAHSDSLAVGALEALNDRGIQVPEEVSVMGFDGTYSFCTLPRLSTMLIPNYEMGKKAAEILLKRIAGNSSGVIREEIKPRIVIQKSTQATQKEP